MIERVREFISEIRFSSQQVSERAKTVELPVLDNQLRGRERWANTVHKIGIAQVMVGVSGIVLAAGKSSELFYLATGVTAAAVFASIVLRSRIEYQADMIKEEIRQRRSRPL